MRVVAACVNALIICNSSAQKLLVETVGIQINKRERERERYNFSCVARMSTIVRIPMACKKLHASFKMESVISGVRVQQALLYKIPLLTTLPVVVVNTWRILKIFE